MLLPAQAHARLRPPGPGGGRVVMMTSGQDITWGMPDDPARLIAWVATDEAGWITGQVIDAEGGFRR